MDYELKGVYGTISDNSSHTIENTEMISTPDGNKPHISVYKLDEEENSFIYCLSVPIHTNMVYESNLIPNEDYDMEESIRLALEISSVLDVPVVDKISIVSDKTT